MKKKVLFVNPSLCQGGRERMLIQTLELLDPQLYDVTVFLFEKNNVLIDYIPDHINVVVKDINKHFYRSPKAIVYNSKKRIYTGLKNERKAKFYSEKLVDYIHDCKMEYPAKRIFKDANFDIVISYAEGKNSEIVSRFDAKRILFFHNSKDSHHALNLQLFPKYHQIIAVNDGVKEMLAECYSEFSDKVSVIYNYIDASRIIAKSKDKPDNTKTKKNGLSICTCGRISHEKGFELAVEAADYLKKQGINFLWLFIGDGADRPKIERDIKEKELEQYIEITGYKDNPYPYMAAADIYVQPSYEEAQPLVLLEAMVLGKPIVSTKTVGGNTILKGGEKGILTDFSGQALAKGIMTLINNPDVRSSLENLYTLEDNEKEKQIYIDKLNQLLSFG